MNARQINLSRLNKSLLSVLLVALLLYLGKPFLLPIAIAFFFAMLLFPLVQKLQQFNIKESMAALLSILLLLATITALSIVVYYQVSFLDKDLPRLEQEIEEKANRLHGYFAG